MSSRGNNKLEIDALVTPFLPSIYLFFPLLVFIMPLLLVLTCFLDSLSALLLNRTITFTGISSFQRCQNISPSSSFVIFLLSFVLFCMLNDFSCAILEPKTFFWREKSFSENCFCHFISGLCMFLSSPFPPSSLLDVVLPSAFLFVF